MSHRRRNKPVEQLRTTWTSTADLEETLQEMFVHQEQQPQQDKLTVATVEQQPVSTIINNDIGGSIPDNLTADIRVNLSDESPDSLAPVSPGNLTGEPAVILTGGPPDILPSILPPVNLSSVPPDRLRYQTIQGDLVDSKCIRTYSSVQEAHTPSEHLVYTTMWKMSGSIEDRASLSREAILPMQAIAAKVAISLRNVRRVLRSLETKLAIEITEYEDKTRSIPRRYRIWGFKAAIDRRRQAGYHFIYRNRNLITLAKLTGGSPDKLTLIPPDTLPVAPAGSLPDEAQVSLPAVSPDNQPHPPPASMSGSLIKRQIRDPQALTSTGVVAALEATVGHSDDDAVSRIVTGCRRVRADATEEEIVHFIQLHGPRFSRMKHIGNPMGALITQLPRCFAGETFDRYRELERQRREAEQAQEADLRAQWQRILTDPSSSEEDRNWARQLLGPE